MLNETIAQLDYWYIVPVIEEDAAFQTNISLKVFSENTFRDFLFV